MRNFFQAALFWAVLAFPGHAQTSLSGLMERVEAFDWSGAVAAARRADPIERDIVWWHALRGGHGTFEQYRAFLARRPDWPGLPLLRQVGEAAIPDSANADDVISYFAPQLPRSARGSLSLAKALVARDAKAIAADEVRRAWLSLDVTDLEAEEFIENYGDVIGPLHDARLNALLWDGRLAQAEAMLPFASAQASELGKARLALMRGEDGVDALIAVLPEEAVLDPGLAHARFIWRIARGRHEDAADLLLVQSARAGGLEVPSAWAANRVSLARRILQGGNARRAYDIAVPHGLSDGSDFAALEWLAGYISLRHLDKPAQALNHFRRFRVAVDTPISLARAGYWEGRAHEALGQKEEAIHAFEFAAEYATAFYGQLAAARIGNEPGRALPLGQDVPTLSDTPLGQSTVLAAALAFHQAGETGLYRRFLRHLAEAGTPPEQAALGQLALEMDEPYTALYLAKYAADHGNVLLSPYFPTIGLPADLPIDPALVLGVIRRESEFNEDAVSRANARGLMQVLPGTGADVAKDIGLAFTTSDLTELPAVNIQLGAAYLAQMAEEFDGYLPAMLVAYNAGPARVRPWQRLPGYKSREIDEMVDWVESVPFAETRNYIMRVSESYQVYRIMLGGDTDWVLPELLTGRAQIGVD